MIIIGVVLLLAICICLCILGQTIISKRQCNQSQHLITNTMKPVNVDPRDRASWMCDFKDGQPSNMQMIKASNMRKFHSQDDILGLPMYQRKQTSHQDINMRKYASQNELGDGSFLLNKDFVGGDNNVRSSIVRPDPVGASKLRFIDEEDIQ